ncbi:hypothetical protein AGMMS49942_06640 [Spirochaetia bacterium]|nr:hypothetical protein AGMMS49942_06640 [Spirochaetia bacterium]
MKYALIALVTVLALSGCPGNSPSDPPPENTTPTGPNNPSGPGPAANYTFSYDGNGSDGGTVPAGPATYAFSQTVTVLGNTGSLVKTGKVFDGWNTNAAGTGTWYRPGDTLYLSADKTLFASWVNTDEKHFWASRITDSSWYLLTAQQLAEGTHCIVYADITAGITPTMGAAVAAKYDTYIHNQITDAFGDIEDVDGNGKVIILMLDIIDGYTGSGGYSAGYFQGYQMYQRSVIRPYSNEADMLYMDTYPGFNPGNQQNFYSTIAHELQHLIEFSQLEAKSKAAKDLWINEGLSTAAEYIYGTGTGSPAHQQARIDYFNAGFAPNGNPKTSIPMGNNFFVWDGYWEQEYGDVLADYATAYLFFQWLRIHANDIAIYKDIIASPYGDYKAVIFPASSRIDSSLSSWGTLLRSWLLANYVKDAAGLLGYKGEINTTTWPFPPAWLNFPSSQQTYLSPGEGVYSTISSSISPSSGGNIKYAGINSGTVSTTGTYTGTLLTFNANSNKAGSDEIGKIAANVVSGPYASVQMSLNGIAASVITAPLPTSYPIDVHFGPDGTLSPDSPRVGTGSSGISAKPLGFRK